MVDLSVLPAAQRPPEVERLAREEARAPFDLAHGPLLRARLLRLGRDEHVLMLAMHHIVSDWWSMGILVKEQAQLYVAFAAGQASPLPELPIQYADYALWQRREQVAERFDGQLQYWTRQLDGAPTRLELPADRPRPLHPSGRGSRRYFDVPQPAAQALAALSRRGLVPWRNAVAGRVALHSHKGRQGHDAGQRRARADLENVSDLLLQIPTLQFLGAVPAPEEFDYDCGPSSLRVERERWLSRRTEQRDAVRTGSTGRSSTCGSTADAGAPAYLSRRRDHSRGGHRPHGQ